MMKKYEIIGQFLICRLKFLQRGRNSVYSIRYPLGFPRVPHLFPVKPKLTQPLKRILVGHTPLNQLLYNVSSVDLNSHKSHDLESLHLFQFPPDGLRQFIEHGHLFLLHGFEGLLVATVLGQSEGFLHVGGPLDLAGGDTQLAGMVLDPLVSLGHAVFLFQVPFTFLQLVL